MVSTEQPEATDRNWMWGAARPKREHSEKGFRTPTCRNLGAKRWRQSWKWEGKSRRSKSIVKGQGGETAGKTGLCLVVWTTHPSLLQQVLQLVFQQPHRSPLAHHSGIICMPVLPGFFFPSLGNSRSSLHMQKPLKLRQQIWGFNTLVLEPDCLASNPKTVFNHCGLWA